MNEAIKVELGKYWDNLPEDLSLKQGTFLLKASHAIDFHEQYGTEPEPYLSSVDLLLDMYQNIEAAGNSLEKALHDAIKAMTTGDMVAVEKAQRMGELPYYQQAQVFEFNNNLPNNPTAQDIAEFKASISKEQLENMLSAAYEISMIRKNNPKLSFEEAHDCFSAMQNLALNHFGKMTGLKLEPDMEADVEENKNRQALRETVMRKPRETLVLTDGCEDTKIFGSGDLKAKLERVEDRAKEIDPLHLDKSIDVLQSDKQKGFDRRLGLGKEVHDEQRSSSTDPISNIR